ncbi:triose-phosphate isomerase [Parapedobacter koreensis]|uniref:Triosephosphate isomerase n=1 Tax=Parapedobacter koreensis TaxID=332977 RepID=A0A1H7I5X3_9SPHI|nr:triose-phosphate isomerase [Parapedobacter koreensis]SEK57941.1 triosephosphate isomerase [Parapedobacter koreensis]
MRKKIVAGNWKMNLDFQQGISLFSEIVNMAKDEVLGQQQVVVCSPFIHLHGIAQLAKGVSRVAIGAQNIYFEEKGAYTGEISAVQVKSAGAEYVILGHSERRAYFNESDDMLSKKVDAALKHGLIPVFCIGETREEREADRYFDVIGGQLEQGVFHLSNEAFSNVVLAYEPVWAIGTGLTASPEQAQEVHAFIRDKAAEQYNQDTADQLTILYGGSCNPQNAPELFAQPDIDGGLIGGASLKSRDFIDIAKVFNN